MSSKLDQSLGDIISGSATPHTQRSSSGRRRRGKATGDDNSIADGEAGHSNGAAHPLARDGGASSGPVRRERSSQRAAPYPARAGPDSGGQWAHDLFQQTLNPPPLPTPLPLALLPSLSLPLPTPFSSSVPTHVQRVVGDTLSISNLPSDVTSDDLSDIFSPLGTVLDCVVHYDAGGRSLGTAAVRMARAEQAERAAEELDGAEVDGKEIMVKLVGQVVSQLVGGVGVGLPRGGGMGVRMLGGGGGGGGGGQGGVQGRGQGGGRGGREAGKGGRGGRDGGGQRDGGGRGGRDGGAPGGRGRARQQAAPVKAEDLDAEMDSYHTTRTQAQQPAPPAATQEPTPSSEPSEPAAVLSTDG